MHLHHNHRARTGNDAGDVVELERAISLARTLQEDLRADAEEAEPTCPACNGSGEGMADGTTCRDCRGSGVARDLDADEDRLAAEADQAYVRAKDERAERHFEQLHGEEA